MNCRRVEKLIPLYVEGDLESRLNDPIASHLEWCGRCNWLADEYKESQSWLRSSEPPEFDEAFLTDLKRDVLTGVSTTTPSFLASLLGSWTQQWNRRQVLALSAALMIIFGVLVLYLYRTRVNDGRAVQELAGQTQIEDKTNPSRPDLTAGTKSAPGASFTGRHRSLVPTTLSRSTVEPPLLSGANKASEPESPRKENEQMIPDRTFDSREMLRIEIQTGDPNIRIIWFAPRETDTSQNKPTTD
jgi:hypothetical protein